MHISIFSLHNVTEEYVYHPINAFNLVKRTTKFLPKVLNNTHIQTSFSFTNHIMLQLANAIYNLEEYYAITPKDLVNGIIRDSETSKIYKSSKKLELDDVLYIQDVAHLYWNYDKQISWLEIALKLAKSKKDSIRYVILLFYPVHL